MGGEPPIEEHLLIILPFERPDAQIERIRKRHPQIRVSYRQLAGESAWKAAVSVQKELFRSATILATLSALPPDPAAAPNLKLVHFFSAGTDHVAHHPIYRDTDITLTTSSGIHGPTIAEWVVMTALAQSHSFKRMMRWQREHEWGSLRELWGTRDMVGQRIGILGYGSIGRQVARVAKAMGMTVIAYTASPRRTPESRRDDGFIVPGTGDPDGSIPSEWHSGVDRASLHRFLGDDLDVLLVSVPLTPQTKHLLGRDEFDILRQTRGTFVSNISRGRIVDQAALVAALKAEPGLRGAALDVTDPEPLPADSELWDMEHVTVTPHISAVSAAYTDRSFQVLDLNLERWETGGKLVNVVDRRRGY
ncbi:MAG: hypothetical protein M1832_004146 [Thelocarpon impressellum]|nr:MAG: hypothetical protein M1832_004146 [Thelocarpon impressellum]